MLFSGVFFYVVGNDFLTFFSTARTKSFKVRTLSSKAKKSKTSLFSRNVAFRYKDSLS